MMQTDSNKGFVQTYLPWLLAGIMLLVYLFTLNRVLTFASLPMLSRVAGWNWQGEYFQPLHYLLTLPIRWAPPSWQLLLSNFFSALCAAAALGLLARSVAILPRDRTREQRQREHSEFGFLTIPSAWIPPVLAVLVCGLELSLWENAVLNTGEALDLLLFAVIVWCLLEYRLEQNERWLWSMSFVYGLSVTNNWAMIGFFPACLAAVLWMRGREFFDFRFVVRMFLCGVGGLLLYFLLPLVHIIGDGVHVGFMEALRLNLDYQKQMLASFPRYLLVLIGLTSLFPILFIGIRWPTSFGDISAAGYFITNIMTHVIHGAFLLAAIYVAFDQEFSPRKLAPGYALLPFYYLGALSIGYFSGYFLLVFGRETGKSWQRSSGLALLGKRLVVVLIWVAVLAVPVALAMLNWPRLRKLNGTDLTTLSAITANLLPQDGAFVLSDDPNRLRALRAELARRGTADKFVLLETLSLKNKRYQKYLREHYPQRWPAAKLDGSADEDLPPTTIVRELLQASATRPLYYLHPSFGYYFEHFYLQPRGIVYAMLRYPTNTVRPPAMPDQVIAENEAFWKKLGEATLTTLAKRLEAQRARDQVAYTPKVVAAYYSRALDFWGVKLQRNGKLKPAGEAFATALELNPENPAAYLNHRFNEHLQAGKTEPFKPDAKAQSLLQPFRGNYNALAGINGPFDEPEACLVASQLYASQFSQNYRQSAQELMRVVHFQPTNYEAQVLLAHTLILAQFPDHALDVVKNLRQRTDPRTLTLTNQLELVQAEAYAYFALDQIDQAKKVLVTAQEQHPQQAIPFAALTQIYLTQGDVTNALEVLNKQLQLQPDNLPALINRGAIEMRMQNYDAARKAFDRVLQMQPDSSVALLNRALVNLHSGQLEAARRDYEAVRALSPNAYQVYYGLAEIDSRQKKNDEAVRHYREYLNYAPRGTEEYQSVRNRIKELE